MPYDIFFPRTQRALALSHTQTLAHRQKSTHMRTYGCRHRIRSSSLTHSAHRQTRTCAITHNRTHCLPAHQKVIAFFRRQSFTVSSSLLIGFTQTQPTDLSQKQLKTPFVFLQWAHGLPRRVTPHISPHHLCVILNFRPFSIFIWTRPDLKALWTEQRKVLFDHTNNL